MTTENSLLSPHGVRLGQSAVDRWDAVRQVGAVFEEIGATDAGYTGAMLRREETSSTYLGFGIAIPHGTADSAGHIHHTGLVVLQFPDGVDWDGERVELCIGIAAVADEQLGLLCTLATIMMRADNAANLRGATEPGNVVDLLRPPTG